MSVFGLHRMIEGVLVEIGCFSLPENHWRWSEKWLEVGLRDRKILGSRKNRVRSQLWGLVSFDLEGFWEFSSDG